MASFYVGLISGTSADGVDAVVAEIGGHDYRSVVALTRPYPNELRRRVNAVIVNPRVTLEELGGLDVALGEYFGGCALSAISAAGLQPGDIRAIGHHGQTIFHRPTGPEPFTWQIGDPNVVAARTGVTTVADFRRLDVACGGQGAPLVPAFHDWLWGKRDSVIVVLNLGGIANVTVLRPGAPVIGFDIGPANTLLDAWISECRGEPFDSNGHWSAGGNVSDELLTVMMAEPYFSLLPPKSTGRELFNLDWLRARLGEARGPIAERDVQATLAELTARSIAAALAKPEIEDRQLVVCGGGAHNRDLIERIARTTGNDIVTTEAFGIAPDWVEAAAFAWLAHARLEGLASNVPTVTGAHQHLILGGVYFPVDAHDAQHDAQPASTSPGNESR